MKFLSPTTYPWLAFALSLALLCGAWTFQYGFGYNPCEMCYWQRHGHKAVLGVAALAIVLGRRGVGTVRLWAGLVTLALLISAGLAFSHMGVELGWWDGPKTCSGGGGTGTIDPTDLLAALGESIKPPACSAVVWSFLGLSMAGWNFVLSLCGAILGIISLRKST